MIGNLLLKGIRQRGMRSVWILVLILMSLSVFADSAHDMPMVAGKIEIALSDSLREVHHRERKEIVKAVVRKQVSEISSRDGRAKRHIMIGVALIVNLIGIWVDKHKGAISDDVTQKDSVNEQQERGNVEIDIDPNNLGSQSKTILKWLLILLGCICGIVLICSLWFWW